MAKSSAAAAAVGEGNNSGGSKPPKGWRKLVKDGEAALKSMGNLKNKHSKTLGRAKRAGVLVAASGTTLATTTAASYAEGRYGPEKMKLGPVDMRTAGAVVAGSIGVVRALQGGADADFEVAVATGLLASEAASYGLRKGQEARAKAGQAPAANNQAQASTSAAAPQDQILQDMKTTPAAAGRGGRHPKRQIQPNREEIPPHIRRVFEQRRRERMAA